MTARVGKRIPVGLRLLVTAAAALVMTGTVFTTSADGTRGARHARGGCTAYASPRGSDRARGTRTAPVRTVGELLRRLGPGDTGCLKAGAVFVEDVAVRKGGTSRRPLTLTTAGTPAATIQGRFYIPEHSDYVHVTNLNLDGRNAERLASPAVTGDYAIFRYDDITNHHTGTCFQIGNPGWGRPVGTLIARNRIHDCGTLPATNLEHGLYVATTVGTTIVNNFIFGNADRGVQLYPDAQNTLVAHNAIVGNGEGVAFGGDVDVASSGNRVVANVIVDSKIRHNVESWWPGPVGHSNVVEGNCFWGADGSANLGQADGFVLGSNDVGAPRFENAGRANFRVLPAGPCAGKGPRPGRIGPR